MTLVIMALGSVILIIMSISKMNSPKRHATKLNSTTARNNIRPLLSYT